MPSSQSINIHACHSDSRVDRSASPRSSREITAAYRPPSRYLAPASDTDRISIAKAFRKTPELSMEIVVHNRFRSSLQHFSGEQTGEPLPDECFRTAVEGPVLGRNGRDELDDVAIEVRVGDIDTRVRILGVLSLVQENPSGVVN